MARLLLIFLCLLSFTSLADENSSFFGSLPKSTHSFVSKCRINGEIHALIFSGSTKNAYYVEMTSGGSVVQMAKIKFNDRGYLIEDAQGGVASYQMVRDQVGKLIGKNFLFKETKNLERFIKANSPVDMACK
ncbi:hypothetical protein [Pseudogulbenkiania subflava]|uniref:hypothetical protein n=1 Tax=Pseudogulbenkiania subflava TaxID=451637 RepID=UPI00117B3381|nr:hypothetical protein [Pseudogulbenkiania subflava]